MSNEKTELHSEIRRKEFFLFFFIYTEIVFVFLPKLKTLNLKGQLGVLNIYDKTNLNSYHLQNIMLEHNQNTIK